MFLKPVCTIYSVIYNVLYSQEDVPLVEDVKEDDQHDSDSDSDSVDKEDATQGHSHFLLLCLVIV